METLVTRYQVGWIISIYFIENMGKEFKGVGEGWLGRFIGRFDKYFLSYGPGIENMIKLKFKCKSLVTFHNFDP